MGTEPAAWLDVLARKARWRAEVGLCRQLRARGPDRPAAPPPDRVGAPPPDRAGGEQAAELIDLAGDDHLGLSRHPAVTTAAAQALAGYGLGATGSRVLHGSTAVHAALEGALAGWLGTGAALVFSSGYLANVAAVRAVAGPGTLLLSDRHAHPSLVDGCRLSGAEVVVLPHADPLAVSRLLACAADRRAVLVTESVFWMDGDLAPLAELHAACRRYGAVLLVDESHAIGLLGPQGAGGVAAAGLAGAPDVVVTMSLSTALGAAGGVVAGPALLIAELVDTGRAFIFDAALPPSVTAGALAALELARQAGDRRAELADRAALVVRRLAAAGLDGSVPGAGVVTVSAPGPEQALSWVDACRALGVAVGVVRPPSTPDGRSRLRITVNAAVPRQCFERAVAVIERCAR